MRTRTITPEDLQTELNEDLNLTGQLERLADSVSRQRRMLAALIETLPAAQLLAVYRHFNFDSALQLADDGLVELTIGAEAFK